MATIKETLVLEDKLSNPMTEALAVCEKMNSALDDIRYSMLNVETASAATAQGVEQLTDQMAKASRQTDDTKGKSDDLLGSLKQLAGAFARLKTAKWLVSTSDQMTQLNARLELMTGSAEGAAAAQEEIYQAAMRSRGAYADMADLVAQLGTLAPEAFSGPDGQLNTKELVGFAEQLQKQMAISGASGASAAAAMTQLTQALASGTLRGDELNSVLEQTPMIAKTIADYMGVSTGTMRDMAAEGLITADVVKNAMFAAAEETNAAFEQMPLTWSQVWTMMQNTALQALDPVLQAISWGANNLNVLAPALISVAAAVGIYMVATKGAEAATMAMAAAQQVLNTVMSANPLALAAMAVVLLVGALYAGVAAFNNLTDSSVSATGIIAGALLGLAATALNLTIVPLYNGFADLANFVGNVFNNPVAAVQVLFLDMASNVLGMLTSVASGIEGVINAIPGMEVDLTSGLESFRANITAASQDIKDASGWQEYVQHMDYFDPVDAYKTGYDWGKDFNPFESLGLSGLSSDGTGGYTPADIPSYDELAGAVKDVGKDVKGIKKSVDLSKEDLKYMVDLTTRKYVNNVNLTSQTPVITINGQNTGNTEADRQALADAIEVVLWEAATAGAAEAIAPRLAFAK